MINGGDVGDDGGSRFGVEATGKSSGVPWYGPCYFVNGNIDGCY